MTWLQTIILGVVEGITEFLPISSTGHMIIASAFMGISEDSFTKLFEVCIQFGAILSVVVLYRKQFFDFKRLRFYLKLMVAFIPAAVFGALFSKQIDAMFDSLTVGMSFLVGGIVLLFIDKMFEYTEIENVEEVGYPKALLIGCFQVIAMIPGVSRSAATIVGGLQQNLTRKFAAEFSFFLAVPTMAAATAKKLWDFHKAGLTFTSDQLPMLAVGNVIAFIVALIAIRTFIGYVQKHSFRAFGVYRILAGIMVISLINAHVLKRKDKPQDETSQTVNLSLKK